MSQAPNPWEIPRSVVNRARHISRVARAATAWWFLGVEMPSAVRCRRRPGRKPCPGRLRLQLDAAEIRWTCPRCGDTGRITDWQDLPCNLSGIEVGREPGPTNWVEVRLPEAEYQELLRFSQLDLAVERVLRAAQGAGDEVIVGGPKDAMEALLCLVHHQAIRRRPSKRRVLLDSTFSRLATVLPLEP